MRIRCSAGLCRAFAGTASRGEEEDDCNSVQSELPGQGRLLHCPEISGHPVKTLHVIQRIFLNIVIKVSKKIKK